MLKHDGLQEPLPWGLSWPKIYPSLPIHHLWGRLSLSALPLSPELGWDKVGGGPLLLSLPTHLDTWAPFHHHAESTKSSM